MYFSIKFFDNFSFILNITNFRVPDTEILTIMSLLLFTCQFINLLWNFIFLCVIVLYPLRNLLTGNLKCYLGPFYTRSLLQIVRQRYKNFTRINYRAVVTTEL